MLNDLLRFENDALAGDAVDDVRRGSNYVDALTHGIELLMMFRPDGGQVVAIGSSASQLR